MTDIVRVMRVLEYEGPREWVEQTIERSHVKGTWRCQKQGIIREAIVGQFSQATDRREPTLEEKKAAALDWIVRMMWPERQTTPPDHDDWEPGDGPYEWSSDTTQAISDHLCALELTDAG